MPVDLCAFCDCEIQRSSTICAHCGQPGRYPNVLNAEDPQEKDALEQRYAQALDELRGRGADTTRTAFEQALKESKAVIARPMSELDRIAHADDQVYATFYQVTRNGTRLAVDDDWDRRRRIADITLFQNFHEEVRFACLSLDGNGLPHYGDCFLEVKNAFIAHRTSLLEENSVLFLNTHGIDPSQPTIRKPIGFSSTWEERNKLCVAKLAGELSPTTAPKNFSSILMKPGKTSADDQFVEVHIFGSLTRRSLERVTLTKKKGRKERKWQKNVILKGLQEKLTSVGVTVRVE